MSYDPNMSEAPEPADLAAALFHALRQGRPSRAWRPAGHAPLPVPILYAPGLTIVPLVSLAGLVGAVSTLLTRLSEPASGAGIILLPEDVPLSNVEDLIEPLVDYGVSVENAGDVLQEAKNLKVCAERRWEETRARWDAQKANHGATSDK
jgi:hypothetical protein